MWLAYRRPRVVWLLQLSTLADLIVLALGKSRRTYLLEDNKAQTRVTRAPQ
jgi:hypothetical protein